MNYRIGDSFIGYKFESKPDLSYVPRMEPYVGQKGRITWIGVVS